MRGARARTRHRDPLLQQRHDRELSPLRAAQPPAGGHDARPGWMPCSPGPTPAGPWTCPPPSASACSSPAAAWRRSGPSTRRPSGAATARRSTSACARRVPAGATWLAADAFVFHERGRSPSGAVRREIRDRSAAIVDERYPEFQTRGPGVCRRRSPAPVPGKGHAGPGDALPASGPGSGAGSPGPRPARPAEARPGGQGALARPHGVSFPGRSHPPQQERDTVANIARWIPKFSVNDMARAGDRAARSSPSSSRTRRNGGVPVSSSSSSCGPTTRACASSCRRRAIRASSSSTSTRRA